MKLYNKNLGLSIAGGLALGAVGLVCVTDAALLYTALCMTLYRTVWGVPLGGESDSLFCALVFGANGLAILARAVYLMIQGHKQVRVGVIRSDVICRIMEAK